MTGILCKTTYVERLITRIGPFGRGELEDVLLREEEWMLLCREKEITVFHCLPQDLEQLAVGHLYCRKILHSASEIKRIQIDEEERRINVTLDPISCFDSHPAAETIFSAEEVHRLQGEFDARCILFRKTGAAHSCALVDERGIMVFREDVARHNALDKVIGEMVLKELPPAGKALVFSGRLASDMLEKVSVIGVKLVIAPGAPSLAAVELAEERDITLLGFVRRDNINIYTHPRRVV